MNIKKIREKLNLSRYEFAEKTGVTVSTVIAWEGGHRTPGKSAQLLIEQLEPREETVAEFTIRGVTNKVCYTVDTKSINHTTNNEKIITFQDGSKLKITKNSMTIVKENN